MVRVALTTSGIRAPLKELRDPPIGWDLSEPVLLYPLLHQVAALVESPGRDTLLLPESMREMPHHRRGKDLTRHVDLAVACFTIQQQSAVLS